MISPSRKRPRRAIEEGSLGSMAKRISVFRFPDGDDGCKNHGRFPARHMADVTSAQPVHRTASIIRVAIHESQRSKRDDHRPNRNYEAFPSVRAYHRAVDPSEGESWNGFNVERLTV